MPETNAPVYGSPSEDPEMDQAAAKARTSFRIFWRELSWERRRIVPGLELAAVKASFSDPPEIHAQNAEALEVEHMWLTDIHFDGRSVQGTLINSPHSLKSIREGDRVKVGGKQVCDWMYVLSGEVYGGFTVDLMRSRMEKSERKQHDRAWGFHFGEPGTVLFVPPEYMGVAAAKKKGLFSRLSSPPPTVPQEFAKVAAAEHPMSKNMRGSLETAIGENPSLLTDTDDAGFNYLHQLALAGSLDGVDVCLQHGADPKLKTSAGMTAFGLAKVLAWKKVMARLEQATST